jgi:uncharacterized cupin superfamily protein
VGLKLENVVATQPGKFASPYHVHLNDDEVYYVVEGEMIFYVGDERVRAESGA